MKEKYLKKRNEFLQWIADFIIIKLQLSIGESEFEFWMWHGLSLDYWCVEKNIYLN